MTGRRYLFRLRLLCERPVIEGDGIDPLSRFCTGCGFFNSNRCRFCLIVIGIRRIIDTMSGRSYGCIIIGPLVLDIIIVFMSFCFECYLFIRYLFPVPIFFNEQPSAFCTFEIFLIACFRTGRRFTLNFFIGMCFSGNRLCMRCFTTILTFICNISRLLTGSIYLICFHPVMVIAHTGYSNQINRAEIRQNKRDSCTVIVPLIADLHTIAISSVRIVNKRKVLILISGRY